MNRTTWFYFGLRIFSLALLMMFAACGSPKRDTTSTVPPLDDTSGFDDFTNTDTSPTGTPTGNLFDDQVGSTDLSSEGPSQLGNPTASEVSCLNGGLQNFGSGQSSTGWPTSGSGTGSGTGSGSGSGYGFNQQVACFNPGALGGLTSSTLYNGAYTSYQAADFCLQQAASMLQFQPGMTAFQIDLQMQLAEIGLIKCKRDIVNFQYNLLPWGNSQAQALMHADHNISFLGQGIQ